MPFIGHDPENLSRLLAMLRSIEEVLFVSVAGLGDETSFVVRRLAHRCGDLRTRALDELRIVESTMNRAFTGQLRELVDSKTMWWFDVVRAQHPVVDAVIGSRSVRVIDALDDPDDDAAIAALVYGTADSTLMREFWLEATDPQQVDTHTAVDRALKLVDAVVNHDWQLNVTGYGTPTEEHWRIEREALRVAAEVAARWQLCFTGLAHRFGVEPEHGRDLLTSLCADAGAASIIMAGLPDAVWRELSSAPNDAVDRRRLIDDVAFAIGASTEIDRGATVDRAVEHDTIVDSIVHLPVRIPIPVPWVVTTTLGAGADAASKALSTTDDVERASTLTELHRREILASLAVAALWSNAVENERVNPNTRAVPPDVEIELQHAFDSISNAAGRGDAFVNS